MRITHPFHPLRGRAFVVLEVTARPAAGGTIAGIDSKTGLWVRKDHASERRPVIPVQRLERRLLTLDGTVALSPEGTPLAGPCGQEVRLFRLPAWSPDGKSCCRRSGRTSSCGGVRPLPKTSRNLEILPGVSC